MHLSELTSHLRSINVDHEYSVVNRVKQRLPTGSTTLTTFAATDPYHRVQYQTPLVEEPSIADEPVRGATAWVADKTLPTNTVIRSFQGDHGQYISLTYQERGASDHEEDILTVEQLRSPQGSRHGARPGEYSAEAITKAFDPVEAFTTKLRSNLIRSLLTDRSRTA